MILYVCIRSGLDWVRCWDMRKWYSLYRTALKLFSKTKNRMSKKCTKLLRERGERKKKCHKTFLCHSHIHTYICMHLYASTSSWRWIQPETLSKRSTYTKWRMMPIFRLCEVFLPMVTMPLCRRSTHIDKHRLRMKKWKYTKQIIARKKKKNEPKEK